jgi:DNA repair protein RecO (recombination protein O)
MRITLHPAFVIHQRPYRETSLIVELFTEQYGRIAAVAKGVKTQRSSLRATLQSFSPLLASWQGKGDLVTLVAAEATGAPMWLKGNCLLSAFYINEILIRLLPKNDPYPKLYTIYHETLLELQQGELQQKTLRIFEKKLLEELGYGLQLQYDLCDEQPFDAEKNYRFYPELGFKPTSYDEKVAEIFLFKGASLLAIARDQLEASEVLLDAKRLMRLALTPLLGPKPLNSRKLFTKEFKVEVDEIK